MPSPCARALDVGCGTGAWARVLAGRAREVDAIDRDPDVIDRARASSRDVGNLRFVHDDVMTAPLAPASYDLVTALASLHHLPLAPALERLRALLRPGGVLAVIGLYREATIGDALATAISFPLSRLRRLGRARPPKTSRCAIRRRRSPRSAPPPPRSCPARRSGAT